MKNTENQSVLENTRLEKATKIFFHTCQIVVTLLVFRLTVLVLSIFNIHLRIDGFIAPILIYLIVFFTHRFFAKDSLFRSE